MKIPVFPRKDNVMLSKKANTWNIVVAVVTSLFFFQTSHSFTRTKKFKNAVEKNPKWKRSKQRTQKMVDTHWTTLFDLNLAWQNIQSNVVRVFFLFLTLCIFQHWHLVDPDLNWQSLHLTDIHALYQTVAMNC